MTFEDDREAVSTIRVGMGVLTLGGRRKLYVCEIGGPEVAYPILCGTDRDAPHGSLSGWKVTEIEPIEDEHGKPIKWVGT